MRVDKMAEQIFKLIEQNESEKVREFLKSTVDEFTRNGNILHRIKMTLANVLKSFLNECICRSCKTRFEKAQLVC